MIKRKDGADDHGWQKERKQDKKLGKAAWKVAKAHIKADPAFHSLPKPAPHKPAVVQKTQAGWGGGHKERKVQSGWGGSK